MLIISIDASQTLNHSGRLVVVSGTRFYKKLAQKVRESKEKIDFVKKTCNPYFLHLLLVLWKRRNGTTGFTW